MNNNTEQKKPAQVVKVPTWLFIMMICMFFILALILLNLRFFRYGLVGKSIEHSDSLAAALLMSPEIFAGLSTLKLF